MDTSGSNCSKWNFCYTDREVYGRRASGDGMFECDRERVTAEATIRSGKVDVQWAADKNVRDSGGRHVFITGSKDEVVNNLGKKKTADFRGRFDRSASDRVDEEVLDIRQT